MAITTLNNRSINRSDTASADQVWTATSATASDFQTGGGITEADQWRITASITSSADITSNLERVDNTSFEKIGTGLTESSGIFTFPSTGLYLVRFNMQGYGASDDNVVGYIYTTTDDSSYTGDAQCYLSGDGSTAGSAGALAESFFNVTSTSTHKVKFNVTSIANGSGAWGSTTINATCFTFIRLGDSQ